MMYSEFLSLMDISETTVSFCEYSTYIEPLYTDDPNELDKYRWCARYGRGLIAIIPAIRRLERENEELKERLADIDDAREDDWKAYQNVLSGREAARKRVGELSDAIQKIKEVLNDY